MNRLYDDLLTDERNQRLRDIARHERLIQDAKRAKTRTHLTLFQRLARLTNRANQPERAQDNTYATVGDARDTQDAAPTRRKRHQPNHAAI